ncbi:cilia- and flagella-associated protein 184 [Paramisgurnus dabryanus]|uniref:cilia- and flagella-associated protein 184 n=1 Tax=Paramisgurnus dabryanus TaxID=90735 RepID=UPI0031F4622F
MEEESAELKQEDSSVSESKALVGNTETFDVQAKSVDEEETETEPCNISETVEDDVVELSVGPQEGEPTEDVSMIPSDAETSEPDTNESGACVVTEEEAGTGPLTDETMEDTEGHHVEEDLSHEDTLTAEDVKEEDGPPALDPDMPEREMFNSTEEPLVPVEEEEDVNYNEHLDLIPELQEENDRLSKLSDQLKSKIAEHFHRKAGDAKHSKLAKDIPDQEQYQKYMDLIEDLKLQYQHNLDIHQHRIEDLSQQSKEKLNQVERELRSFALLKNEAVMTAVTGKVGKQETLEKMNQLQADEQKREDELVCVRLKNIKIKNKIHKLEAAFQSQQELADGLLRTDFEQLKTENRTCKEKFKERSEELLKLKKKIANSVQVITYVKRKMHFMQMDNMGKRTQLAEADALVALKRDMLTRTQQARDSLRADNLKLQQQCGLLGNTPLLRDFEERVDTSESLQQRLETLKRRQAELILKCAGVKQKVEQCKPEGK